MSAYSLEKVELYLKWKHQFQFAGYYAALEKGFYEEAGLDVKIIERDIEWRAVDKVLSGVRKYGISDSTIVLDYLADRPVVLVSSIFQHSPLVLITRKEDQLVSPIELKGKRVMYQKNTDDAVFKIMFETAGISEDSIIHVPHNFNNDELINKKVDAISGYRTNQPYYYKSKGLDVMIIDPQNYGVDLYGDSLFTSRIEVDDSFMRVEAMRSATIKGWYYALNHIEEISKLIVDKYNPKLDIDKLIFEGRATKKVIQPDLIPVGKTQIGRLKRIADNYKRNQETSKTSLENLILENYLLSKTKTSTLNLKILAIALIIAIFIFGIIIYFNKLLKAEINKKTLKLKRNQEQKDLFFSTMTHELRTPINGIIGATYFLKEAKSESERSEFIDAIDRSGQNLLEVVNDILDFSKLSRRKIVLNSQSYPLKKLLEESLYLHGKSALRKKIDFKLDLQVDPKAWVMIDAVKFSQIINNIVGNAIKFTRVGSVEVSCVGEKRNDRYHLSFVVKDTGIGVKDEELENLFIPFKQSNKSISSEFGGTGLGLSISKELVDLMDGHLFCRQNLPNGMVFEFHLPLELGEPIDLDEAELAKFPNYSFLRVLIADDSKLNLLLLKKYLNKFNIEPEMATNGKIAIDKLEEKQFDILMLDNQMPVLDGVEATSVIRNHTSKLVSNVYIVGQSASWGSGLDPECEAIGMNATLAKPTRVEDVQSFLKEYMKTIR